MSQEIQDLADFVFGTQSTQQYPNPAPSDPGPSHSSAIVHPGNTETHGLHAGFSDPAGSSANSGEAAQEVSELGTGDLLLDWDPAAIDQHAETDEASNSVVVSHTDAALQMEVAQQTGTPAMNDSGTIGENNSENTDDTDTPGPLPDVDFNEVLHPSTNDTGTQQVLFSFGMQAGNFMENLSVQNLSNHMPPPLTAEQQAILAQGGMLVAEAEAIIASALANGRLSRYAGNGPSREEAVEFVAGLERVELGSLAEDDRVSNTLNTSSLCWAKLIRISV